MAKKRKHRAIAIGEEIYISMCETCKYMPEGKIPRTNEQVKNGTMIQHNYICTKKAYVPQIDYDGKGSPFYDVAECDSYEDYKQQKIKNSSDNFPKRAE